MYFYGAVNVSSSEPVVVGVPSAMPNAADNEWTSDHIAFLSIYKLLGQQALMKQRFS